MGNCCGYLRVNNGLAVMDPASLDNIKIKCDLELQNSLKNDKENKGQLNEKSSTSQENVKGNSSNNNSSSQENIDKHGTCLNKDEINIININSNNQDAIIVNKPEKPHIDHNITNNTVNLNIEIKEEDDSSPSKKKNLNLKPAGAPEHRRDSRATTSINNLKKEKKPEVEAEKKIDVLELKLSARLIDKIDKLQSSQRKPQKENSGKLNLRSVTMGNDGLAESVDFEEKEEEKEDDDKTKEEITKELKENRATIEQNHKKLTIIQNKAEENKGKMLESGIDKRKKSPNTNGNSNNINSSSHTKQKANEDLPRKSLLKRYKTIGNENEKKKKGKKKVKFQDLVDKKKKKKANQNKF